MAEANHPPVPGTDYAPIKFIAGYSNRQRHAVGASLVKLLSRFFEFATAVGTGAGNYAVSEPPRVSRFDGLTDIELVMYGSGVPKDMTTVITSLKTLLGSCPYFIWSDPYEPRKSNVPNIMYSPDVVTYLSNLSVEKESNGLVLKGMHMSRQSEQVTYAYPFKVYLIYFFDNQAYQLGYKIAFGGHLKEFHDKLMEFYKFRIVHDDGIERMRLEYLHKVGPIYLTRGRRIITNIIPEINISSGGMSNSDALLYTTRGLFTTREAVSYAMESLPENQFSKMYREEMRNTGTERYNFSHADGMLPWDTSPEGKQVYISSKIKEFLSSYGQAPAVDMDIGSNWGLPYIERLVAIDNSFNIVEEKIRNAIGSDYPILVPEDKRMITIPEYLKKLQVERKNLLHMSETALDQDFRSFLATSLR